MNKIFYGTPKARTDNIVVSELQDELLLYCLETHQAFCLNQTAAAVYQTADGVKSMTEIADAISKKLKSKVEEDFVLFTLNELKSQNLVEFSAPDMTKTNGFSRREAIRRIGLSTVIALPVITMLVAPKAAEAASAVACANDGDLCGNLFPDCCTGLICCPFPAGLPEAPPAVGACFSGACPPGPA